MPSDLSTYPTNSTIKDLASDKRNTDVLESGASYFVEWWPIPSLSIWAHCDKAEIPSTIFRQQDHL